MGQTFSLKNSLQEVLNEAGEGIRLFFPEAMLQFIPEEYRTRPMEEWADSFRMPWGMPFGAADLVEDANMLNDRENYWDWVPLWVGEEEFTPESNDLHSVSLMIPKCALEGVRPAALICPGGGYENISFHNEGYYTAKRLEQAGYRTFILNYRVFPNLYPQPQTDLALAIKYLRANADQYQIDPDNLMILGYSAGGHLCASTTALRDEINEELQKELEKRRPDLAEKLRDIPIRPDKVCLGYSVISFAQDPHEDSFLHLTGGDETLRDHLSVEKQVDPDYPMTFLWTCADDTLVPPVNTEYMKNALEEMGVDHLCLIYPQGEHGCHLGTGTSAEGWMDEMLDFMNPEEDPEQ